MPHATWRGASSTNERRDVEGAFSTEAAELMRAINGRLVSKFHGGALARVARAGPPPMQGMKATAPWWGATGQVCAVSPVADGGVGSATGPEEVIPDQLCKPFKPVLLHAVPFRGRNGPQ